MHSIFASLVFIVVLPVAKRKAAVLLSESELSESEFSESESSESEDDDEWSDGDI